MSALPALERRHAHTRLPCPSLPPTPRLSQIIRSRDRLLDQLYNYLMGLKPYEVDALLAEDPTLVKRCAAGGRPAPGQRSW